MRKMAGTLCLLASLMMNGPLCIAKQAPPGKSPIETEPMIKVVDIYIDGTTLVVEIEVLFGCPTPPHIRRAAEEGIDSYLATQTEELIDPKHIEVIETGIGSGNNICIFPSGPIFTDPIELQ